MIRSYHNAQSIRKKIKKAAKGEKVDAIAAREI